MRNFFVSLTMILVGLVLAASGAQAGVYLEVEVPEYDYIPVDTPVTIKVMMDNDVGATVTSISHGFRIYSLNGAVWQTPIIVEGPDLATYLDFISITAIGVDGTNDDTISLGAIAAIAPGVPDGYEGLELFRINTQVSDSEAGDTICIDSAFIPPSGMWMWDGSSGSVMPAWGGPYCWTIGTPSCYANGDANDDGLGLSVSDLIYLDAFINFGGPEPIPLYSCNFNGDGVVNSADLVIYEDFFVYGLSVFEPYGGYPVPGPCNPTPEPSCCVGIRGNIDGDVGENIDISDLVYMVDWMFTGGPAPLCGEEADLNGDDVIDIADLVYLVDYMFSGGPAPVVCP